MQSLIYIAASNGAGNASLSTIQNVRTPGAVTNTVNTVAGFPVNFYATMGTPRSTVDPVTGETITVVTEASAVDFAGVLNAGKIDIVAIAPGYTDLGSKVGDIIIVRPITEWANNLFNVLSQSLNVDGTIKDTAIPSVADHIQSGGIWSTLTLLNAAMTTLIGFQNTNRGTVAAVATRAFTASKDTYVDVLRNTTTNLFTLVYTEVANNAASPALAVNSIRLAKVITSGAAITSITQSGKDSLANLIYPLGSIGGENIQSYKVQRRNNTVNITENTAVMQTGWVAISPPTGLNASTTVTFPNSFTNVPIVTATYGGDSVGATSTLGSGAGSVSAAYAQARSVTITNVLLTATAPTGGWSAGNTVYIHWMAIGV